jgi:antitoxin PrlF
MKAILAERGQVTIPKTLRDKLGLAAGSVLDFEEEGGRLVARKQVADPIAAIIGCLPQAETDPFIAELRGQ